MLMMTVTSRTFLKTLLTQLTVGSLSHAHPTIIILLETVIDSSFGQTRKMLVRTRAIIHDLD